MNYIELINRFWQLHETEEFQPTEIALYFYLLKVNNSLSWSPSFRRNNSRVTADLGMSYKVLSRSRNRLKQIGIINFSTKNGSPNTWYSLLTFVKKDEVGEEVEEKVGEEVMGEVRTRSGPSKNKYKLNQTKPKEMQKKSSRFSPPTVDEVFDYMLEKKLPDRIAKIESQKFYNFYDSKNWYVGKNKMSKWKSAVSGWISRMQNTHQPQRSKFLSQEVSNSKLEKYD